MWGFQQEYSRNLLKDELVGRYLHKSCLLATEVLKFLDQDELAALYLNRSAWQTLSNGNLSCMDRNPFRNQSALEASSTESEF